MITSVERIVKVFSLNFVNVKLALLKLTQERFSKEINSGDLSMEIIIGRRSDATVSIGRQGMLFVRPPLAMVI